jgi:hypothetical protein
MQDRLRWAAGTRASTSALIVIAEHQQGVSNVPLRASAQSFGPPQRGQR